MVWVNLNPDVPHRYDDQYDYLCGFIGELDIGSNLTPVIHDWGSTLGFRWAHDHADDVRAIPFMEAMIRTLSLDDMPASLRMAFRMMLPDLTYATMSEETLAYYRSAFATIASRKAVLQWPA